MKATLFLFLLLATNMIAAEVAKITATDAAALVAAGNAVLVDVREPAEWAQTGVAAPAVLLPESDYEGAQKLWPDFLAHVGDKQIILYCRSGRRSGLIAAKLAEKGLPVANAGRFQDWQAAGLPTRAVTAPKP
jgi:rhodanese-related sulfurtransferase